MAKETRRTVTVAAAVIALASIGAGFEGTTWDTGETRELINRPDCRTGDIANGWDGCLVR
jgi:hypothetical protein